jgi:hypothetical protein
MPTWLGRLLLKLLFQACVTIAQKMGMMNKVEAVTAKGAYDAQQFIAHLKTYSSPDDFPKEVKNG